MKQITEEPLCITCQEHLGIWFTVCYIDNKEMFLTLKYYKDNITIYAHFIDKLIGYMKIDMSFFSKF